MNKELSKRILKRINKIEKKLKKQKLNKDFIIDEERYLFPEESIIDKSIEIFTGDERECIDQGLFSIRWICFILQFWILLIKSI